MHLNVMPLASQLAQQVRQERDLRAGPLDDEWEHPSLPADDAQHLAQRRQVPLMAQVLRPGEKQVRTQRQVDGLVGERQLG